MANTNNSQAAENASMEELKKKLADAEARAAEAEEAKANAISRAEEAEKKNADAEAALAAMQTQQKCAENGVQRSDKVRIKIPLVKNGPKEDVQVFINGRQYIIQRGAEVDVPRGVAEILHNKEKMLEVIDAFDKAHAK